MGYLKIHCASCGKSWEVYNRDDWHDTRAQTCPHCFEQIGAQTWHEVIRAFAEMEDANRELLGDYIGDGNRNRPLFSVDYVAVVPPDEDEWRQQQAKTDRRSTVCS